MELVLNPRKSERLMVLKVHHDGFKRAYSLRVAECGSLREIKGLYHQFGGPIERETRGCLGLHSLILMESRL